jgi:glycosyltransferase involved in cell wall biosynthesis
VIRVGYIAGEPTPYRAPHLDRIAALPGIELRVIYAAPTVQRRTWTLDLHHDAVFLEGRSLPLTRLLHHDYPLTPSIWPLLELERFDCLVIGGWSLMATQLAIVWARLRRVPYFLVSENHLREPRPAWIRGLRRIVLPPLVRGAAGQLVTGSLAREHVLAYGAHPETITIFPNTVDVAALERRADELRRERPAIREALGIPEAAVAVLHVGRLIPFKAIETLLDAVAAAPTETPLHVLVVGDGPLRNDLERHATALGLSTTFTGLREGDELVQTYVAADVFALLSLRETWGIVVNEAAACGLPLVLSDRVGASADLLRPGENGELIRVSDFRAAARAIARLADDAELRARSGSRSREFVRPWGYDASVEDFRAAVERAVSGAR